MEVLGKMDRCDLLQLKIMTDLALTIEEEHCRGRCGVKMSYCHCALILPQS